MTLSKEIEKLKYDTRLTDWHLAQGILTQEELKKHLSQLPDSASNVETFEISDEELADDDIDDMDEELDNDEI